MKRLSSIGVLVFGMFSGAMAEAPNETDAVTIPLDEIWAFNMPGSRELEESATPADMRRLRSVFESSYRRAERLNFNDLARPGFAVSGSGVSALEAASAVFDDGGKPRSEFSSDEEITIVFFSEPISRYRVQIRKVERKDNMIGINYELEQSIAGNISRRKYTNFALIPLGRLPVGKYRVEMRQLPSELTPAEIKAGLKSLDEKWSREFLSKPFSFSVIKVP